MEQLTMEYWPIEKVIPLMERLYTIIAMGNFQNISHGCHCQNRTQKGEPMTDTEMQRRKEICDVAGVADIGELSDGFHTFNGLYEQRMILFAALVKAYKNKAWKSYRHEDGEYCFGGGWFIVGIDTPEGSYTYHYENKYWDMFECVDLPRAKHWDGHTEADAETRLMSLEPERKKMRLSFGKR